MYASLEDYRSIIEEEMGTIASLASSKEGFSHIDPTMDKSVHRSTLADYIPMVFYINLDHRTDRKEALEKELDELGLPNERFSAIKHSFGAVGCSKSHVAVLKLAKERKYPRVLILEDDFTFTVHRDTLEREIGKIRDDGKPYDVFMLAYNVMNIQDVAEPYWKKIINAQTTSAYIIQEHYYDALINVVETAIPQLESTRRTGDYAIDVVMKQLQPNGKWYCPTERLGKQRASYSDIENRDVNYNV
jgi:glycosyl transferase, family 25